MFRESLVNRELLVPLATADLPDPSDPLDLQDLLERLVERSGLNIADNNISYLSTCLTVGTMSGLRNDLCHVCVSQGTPGSDGPPGRDGSTGVKVRESKSET